MFGLFLWFAAGVPKANNMDDFIVNTVHHLAQTVDDDTPKSDRAVVEEWVNRAKVRVLHERFGDLVDILSEFLHTLDSKPFTDIFGHLPSALFCL